MKQITYILLALGLLASCDSVLDQKPYISIPDTDVFKSAADAQYALEGIYDALTHEDYYGRLIYAYEGSKGPDFYVEDTGNRFLTENAYRETSSSNAYATDAWDKIYSTVFLCNKIISNIDQIEGEQDEVKRIKGEALAIRALCYFDLMRLFAYPPIYSCPEGSLYQEKYKRGVPLILSEEDNEAVISNPVGRDDAKSCYDRIVTDFSDASDLLSGVASSNGKISQQAVNALLARTYLYLGKWENAITAGEAAKNGGSILDYDQYKTNYYKPFNSENIWELSYSVADNLSSNSLNHIVRNPTIDIPDDPEDGKIAEEGIGYAGYGGNIYLRAVLREIATDVRAYLICDNELGPETGIRKYIGDGMHSIHNITMVRLPEVYLTLAEAYAESDNLPAAEAALNELYKKRTQTTYSVNSKDQLIADILKERRKELVLEGHTYWDHFRRAIPFDREARGSVNNEVAHIDFTIPQVVYPIPQDEMEANPNIRGEQNPGYSPYVTGQ